MTSIAYLRKCESPLPFRTYFYGLKTNIKITEKCRHSSFFYIFDSDIYFDLLLSRPLFKQIKILPFLFCTQYVTTKDFFFSRNFHTYTDINHKYIHYNNRLKGMLIYMKINAAQSENKTKRNEKKKFLIKSFVRCVSMKTKLC